MLVPKGYRFAATGAGFKYKDRDDVGAVVSDEPAAAAGVFTTNKFQAAPVLVAKDLLEANSEMRAVMINSGQANACTGDEGRVNCRVTLEMAAEAFGLPQDVILPASTGVIGDHLKMDKWKSAMPALTESLGEATALDMAKAIMTTDAFPKVAWAHLEGCDKEVRVFGMAKGAGMICPNMATMLGVVLTDAQVDPETWRKVLKDAVDGSFNRITIDGDTSTNDTVFGLANGASGVVAEGRVLKALSEAVMEVCRSLSYMIVQDAEGGTKVVRIEVGGAANDAQAEVAARTVGHSPLVKTAMYGCDPNWGRIAAALGRCGAQFDPDHVVIAIGGTVIFRGGRPVNIDIDSLLAPTLKRQDIVIDISLGEGDGSYVLLASDLTHEYVTINADYRT